MIDLHLHTTASDGTIPPEAVLAMAAEAGYSAIAITDHDTCEGARALLGMCGQGSVDGLPALSGVSVVPGVEISCGGDDEIHILGYGIDACDPGLNELFKDMRLSRERRGVRIVEKLLSIGVDITERVPDGSPNRPVIAAALVECGFARDMSEAFRIFLVPDGKAYVEREKPACSVALEMIRRASGVAVWAHPVDFLVRSGGMAGLSLLESMVRAGLSGLECYHSECAPGESAALRRIAARHGLLVTGGSDFHGTYKPRVSLGTGLEDWHDWRECFGALCESMGVA